MTLLSDDYSFSGIDSNRILNNEAVSNSACFSVTDNSESIFPFGSFIVALMISLKAYLAAFLAIAVLQLV
jgi:hypothetical protein